MAQAGGLPMATHPDGDELLAVGLMETRSAGAAGRTSTPAPPARNALEAARDGLDLADEASEVPEPPPLYWEAFRRQVGRRSRPKPRPWRTVGPVRPGDGSSQWPRGGLLVVFVPTARRGLVEPTPRPVSSRLGALPAAADDAGLEVLQALALPGTTSRPRAECASVVDVPGGPVRRREPATLPDALRNEVPGGQS